MPAAAQADPADLVVIAKDSVLPVVREAQVVEVDVKEAPAVHPVPKADRDDRITNKPHSEFQIQSDPKNGSPANQERSNLRSQAATTPLGSICFDPHRTSGGIFRPFVPLRVLRGCQILSRLDRTVGFETDRSNAATESSPLQAARFSLSEGLGSTRPALR